MVEELQKLETHDAPLKSISYNFNDEVFKYIIDFYNEDNDDYGSKILKFYGVKNIKLDKLDELYIDCIATHDVIILENGYLFKLEFLGENCKNYFLEFEFSKVIIN